MACVYGVEQPCAECRMCDMGKHQQPQENYRKEKGKMENKTEMENAAKIEIKYRECFTTYINRPGAAELLEWMRANGFFEAPASTKHHGAKLGGLAQHSINVFRRLAEIAMKETKLLKNLNLETLAITALLHDLCKIDAYKPTVTGNTCPHKTAEEKPKWEYTNNFPVGHGEKSIILIMRFMWLTEEEMLAIRWHMGAFDSATRGGSADMNNAFKQCKLAVMLHLADMMATHFDETEEGGNELLRQATEPEAE